MVLWHLDIAKIKRRWIVPSLPQESTARYQTIVVVDYVARHYLDIHWYAHTMTPRMHHERTTSTCISVSRAIRFYESTGNANGRFVHASLNRLAGHSTTHSIDPQNSRRRRRDDAPTAVPNIWRSVFVRRMRRVSWTATDRQSDMRARTNLAVLTTRRGGACHEGWLPTREILQQALTPLFHESPFQPRSESGATPVTTHALRAISPRRTFFQPRASDRFKKNMLETASLRFGCAEYISEIYRKNLIFFLNIYIYCIM